MMRRRVKVEKIVYDVADLQSVLGIGRETAYALMRNRSFPSIRVGRRFMVEKTALQDWLKQYKGKTFTII